MVAPRSNAFVLLNGVLYRHAMYKHKETIVIRHDCLGNNVCRSAFCEVQKFTHNFIEIDVTIL